MNRNVTATILIVLAVGIYFTVTKEMMDQAKQVRLVNAQYSSAIYNAEQLIRVRDQVLEAYNNIREEDRQRLDKMIPNTVDNIRLIIDLNSVAARHGLVLRNIKAETDSSNSNLSGPAAPAGPDSFAQNISNPTLGTVTVSFNTEAPYLSFISFLQDLEANLRIMDVSRLTLTAEDSGVYTYSVGLQTYWLKE